MGPRRNRRGDLDPAGGPNTNLSLQWGHAEIGVETICPRRPVSLQRKLQWGHAEIGVETPSTWLKDCVPKPLQWGHAEIGVETPTASPANSTLGCFNGATPK